MNRFDLNGRVALVTGASSGIGAELALSLAQAGARVVAAARRADRLKALVQKIEATGGSALSVSMDVTSQASVEDCYAAAERTFGTVDTVYANAGINAAGNLLDVSVDDFDQVMATNVRGTFLTARTGAKRMIAGGAAARGRIVIVGSVTGLRPARPAPVYSVSKAAVHMVGRALAQEMAPTGINVTVVCPGSIETELNAAFYRSDSGQERLRGYPRERTMAIGEILELLLFLGSDGSRCVTGSIVKIDDGQLPE